MIAVLVVRLSVGVPTCDLLGQLTGCEGVARGHWGSPQVLTETTHWPVQK